LKDQTGPEEPDLRVARDLDAGNGPGWPTGQLD
jgi:hypothetical protein